MTDVFFGDNARFSVKLFVGLIDFLVTEYIGLNVLSLLCERFAFGRLGSFYFMRKHYFEGFEKRLVADLKIECVNSFLIKLRFILFVIVIAKYKRIA